MQATLNFDEEVLAVDENTTAGVVPFKSQLLKWIGNKQRFAHEIISFFPSRFRTYHEPFLGSGAVLGVLAPRRAVAADSFRPLIDIWKTLRSDPEMVKDWYRSRWLEAQEGDKVNQYEKIKARIQRESQRCGFPVPDARCLRWRGPFPQGGRLHVDTLRDTQTDPLWFV